ncbi:MAG: methyltransferase domain-containing protein [Pirellulales bacterium]|nr:methyltransferase domain-containing protein [Pirellulales bacterium]
MDRARRTAQAVLDYCCCPESGGPLASIEHDGHTLGYWCHDSQLVYPATDDIPLLLPSSARNAEVELPLIEQISAQAGSDAPLQSACQRTREVLATRAGQKSWEWEDEEYWNQQYAEQLANDIELNWNDRLWERDDLVAQVLSETSLAGKCIVEVGCGEGQNFHMLLAPHCDASTLYIAADISLAALKLNRARNPHKNALYLLGTADRLPLKPRSVDLMTYFGILHHSPAKAATLSQNAETLRPGSFILLAEAIDRPHLGKLLPGFLRDVHAMSAHEERVPEDSLQDEMRRLGEILILRREHSIFRTVAFRATGSLLRRNRTCYETAAVVDRNVVRTLGRALPWFGAGTVIALLKTPG